MLKSTAFPDDSINVITDATVKVEVIEEGLDYSATTSLSQPENCPRWGCEKSLMPPLRMDIVSPPDLMLGGR
jgi:hypothetical protein